MPIADLNAVPASAGILYLAGPYTDPDAAVRIRRYRDATIAAAKLIARRYVVYSPLTMTHPIDVELAGEGKTLGSDFWVAFDEAFMAHCFAIVVLTTQGWEDSRGVQREIAYFESRGRPVILLQPSEMDL
jgi:hypothetical protein